MAKLTISRIVRSGKKFQSRVETSDGHQLVMDHSRGRPYVGMELDIQDFKSTKSEIRPLCKSDKWPELILPVDVHN